MFVSYDAGYPSPLSCTQVTTRNQLLMSEIARGTGEVAKSLDCKHCGLIKNMTILETMCPYYFQGIFRYVTYAIGAKSSFEALAIEMRMKINSLGEKIETISIHAV